MQLARDESARRRALAGPVAQLLCAGSSGLSDHERSLAAEIMRQLLKDLETPIRRALAERLSREQTAPRELVLLLANDAIEVAFPILQHSGLLLDPELIEIIRHRTREHRLAIALRRRVSSEVSQALVDTGDTDVIRTLLENQDAEIKAATLAYLVEQSQRVDTFQNPLLRRRELSPELAGRMYGWVSAALRQHILERFDIDESRLEIAMTESATAAAAPLDGDGSANLAERLDRHNQITSKLLIDTLRDGEIALFRELFGRRMELGKSLVDRLIFEPGGEGLAVACKAKDFSQIDFLTLFSLTHSPHPHSADERPRIAALFHELDRVEAARTLDGWRRNAACPPALCRMAAAPGGRPEGTL